MLILRQFRLGSPVKTLARRSLVPKVLCSSFNSSARSLNFNDFNRFNRFKIKDKWDRQRGFRSPFYPGFGPFDQFGVFRKPSFIDTLKVVGLTAVIGGFFLFIAAPFLIVVLPTLFIGGFITSRVLTSRRHNALNSYWNALSSTELKYYGSSIDSSDISRFTINRIIDSFQLNELGIKDYFAPDEETLRLKLDENNIVIDQDVSINPITGQQQQLIIYKFKLIESGAVIAHVTTVLKPHVNNLLQISESFDCIIKIDPNFNLFGKSFVLKTGTSYSGKTIDINSYKSF